MISVGSRDGRKRIGLGIEMEEAELEEGEALGYHEEGEASTIDPDIALSYIEEKVQRCLGHLQKDFEGGVSAENLGSKFGGYGSFLPTYQRSPSWSHTRSPAEAHNYDSFISPRKDQRQNSLASSSGSLKGNGYLKSKHGEESRLKSGDKKSLKVRIRVGSENLSDRKNDEIYSGLGLVLSPSSSMDDSPTTSEGRYGKLLYLPDESPTSILEIMTSDSSEVLLSPLSDDLISLTEKRKSRGKRETKPFEKASKKSELFVDGSLSSRSNQNNVSPLKKERETDIDPFGYEELVSSALKLPLLSSAHHIVADPSKDGMKRDTVSPFIKKVPESKEGNLAIKEEKPRAFDQSESTPSKGIKAHPSKELISQKGGLLNEEVPESSLKKPSNVSKRKQNEAPTKEHEKSGSRYKDFFGDIEFEDDDNESVSGEISLEDRHLVGKGDLSKHRNISKDINTKTPEKYVKPLENGPISEAPIGSIPLVQEDWVLCDKCKKWRLLPLGTNPKSLPDKWLCRMLTWLPGMNHCSITEEETTNALRALYHPVASVNAPPPLGQDTRLSSSTLATAVMTAPDSRKEHQEVAGKKKHWPATVANVEKIAHIGSSDKGANVKLKSKRESDMEGSRTCKRIKSNELHIDDENWTSDNGKAGHRSSSLSNNSGIDREKSNNHNDEDSRKRSANEHRGSTIHNEPVSSSGQHYLQSGDVLEQLCESERRKEKRARLSGSGRKTTSESKASVEIDRKKFVNNTPGVDYPKSELDSLNPSVAANSSSSKVSGSHKSKTNGHEVKGSPVESVSSSPRRFSNADKVKVDAVLTVDSDPLCQINRHSSKKRSAEQTTVEIKTNNDQSQSGVRSKKSGKSSSSHNRDKASASNLDKIKIKNSRNDASSNAHSHEEKSKSRRNKSDEKSSTPNKVGNENDKLPKKGNQMEVRGNGLPPLARIQTENAPISGSKKESGSKSMAVDSLDNCNAGKSSNQRKKPDNSNGQPPSYAANNILKEAKDLKHMADRLKNSGSNGSVGLYFEAALKFLHGASLLESGNSEAAKHNELMHSQQIYSSTAKLCEFCAHEYEKSKDMAAAALSYKCVEVAYMRVVYSSHSTANRERNEFQAALQIVAPGESPSSSASDVDNLTHQATADKAASAKVVGSPQVSGSQFVTSRNRSGLLRILNFAQDVTSAMEASRKSRIAFAAAASKLGETSHREGMDSLRKALDYNFQDVEGLLQLVRVAMEAIGR